MMAKHYDFRRSYVTAIFETTAPADSGSIQNFQTFFFKFLACSPLSGVLE